MVSGTVLFLTLTPFFEEDAFFTSKESFLKVELLGFVVLLNTDSEGESFKDNHEISKMTDKVTLRPKHKKKSILGFDIVSLAWDMLKIK